MQRRQFIRGLGGVVATGTALGMASMASAKPAYRWKMVTAWPKNFPGLGTGANRLAERINQMSGGRIRVKVYGAGELVPAFEAFDAVSRGTAQMGHAGPYYWKGKGEVFQFFSAVPFGFTPQEVNAWLYYGGGMDLWRQLYADFNLVPAAAGNTGTQMAGWFRKEIRSVEDLKGLKMRIPGLGGEVLKRAGGTPVNIPGGELFTALQSGAIDATEWVGPYNDLAFGLYKAAKYYYYPGWHEPGSVIECFINKQAFESLPKDLQHIVLGACQAANIDMLSEMTARNQQALETLVTKHGVQVKPLPDDVLRKLKGLADEVVAEIAASDPFARKVHESYRSFHRQVSAWSSIAEQAFMRARSL
ncbi:MAG TPA: TRAP transporter substrate-binding protein [Methylothermaceae bacterium]|nr:TRAP transporter substrate-binding protein [Methylothermaceae bacterium]